jgi:hypothetical protein
MTDELVQWTAWLAMAALGASAAARLARKPGQSGDASRRRALWSAACVLLWIHVACAFQFVHHWSHAAAYAHTARQTAQVTGFDWGGGIYFNYLLMILWAGDVAWWWLAPRSFRARPPVLNTMVCGFVAFMAINAAVVFAAGPLRWLALGVILVLGVWAIRRRTRARTP